MDDKLRFDIWKKDRYTCQNCKTQMYSVEDAKKSATDVLKRISEVEVYKWLRKCWYCQKHTPIVSYWLEIGCSIYSIGDIEKLDEVLLEKYPFVLKIYSKTARQKTIANICKHCEKLQGNWFINEEIQKMHCEDVDFDKIIDQRIPCSLLLEDLPDGGDFGEITTRFFDLGEIHHKDKNPKNNNPENLVLLCKKCHKKIHEKQK